MKKEILMEYLDEVIRQWNVCSKSKVAEFLHDTWKHDCQISIWTLEDLKKNIEENWEELEKKGL